jgi:DNA-binding XRE family transcriptional regulator
LFRERAQMEAAGAVRSSIGPRAVLDERRFRLPGQIDGRPIATTEDPEGQCSDLAAFRAAVRGVLERNARPLRALPNPLPGLESIETNWRLPKKGHEMTITPGQLKIARQLLGWTASEVAIRVGVSEKTILAFEAGDEWSPPFYLDLVREHLETAGVEFIAENGGEAEARLRKATAE